MSKIQSSSPVTETMIPQATAVVLVQRWWMWGQRWGQQWGRYGLIALLSSTMAGLGVIQNAKPLQTAEREMQSRFWQWRGPVTAPSNVVILGIDTRTLNEVGAFPFDRRYYAQTIEKILGAGAKGVALDILLASPRDPLPLPAGQAEEEDCEGKRLGAGDRALQETLKRYGDRVTLATSFSEAKEGNLNQMQLVVPYCAFQQPNLRYGNIDFNTENEVYHQLGDRFLQQLQAKSEVYRIHIEDFQMQPFANAAAATAGWQLAARAETSRTKTQTKPGHDIYYYGGAGTFETISLADVLTPDNWGNQFQNGAFFKDKLVLLGAVDRTLGDVRETPLGMMPGVEIHANALATLMQGRAVRPLLSPWAAAALVMAAVLGAAAIQAQAKQPAWRLLWTGGLMLAWLLTGYGLLTQMSYLIPTVMPLGAIGLTGLSYVGLGFARDRRRSNQLEATLQDRSRDPVVRDIINQQTDEELKQKLLQGRQQELLGARIGGGRYEIIKIHSAGGFGETYIAEDLHRPDRPKCVVKKLSPARSDPRHLKLARRLFQREAETLEKLGNQHDQIPQLLAYFEEDAEFYLVQEFIDGNPLSTEISLGRQLPETQVVSILREILQLLNFVHSQDVIHRDIKPSNLIRRKRDNRLVLIDFGAVKEIQNAGDDETPSDLTIGIGTQGYMAPEQQAGHPQPNSDIYALGMMGVQMLMGVSPGQLTRNSDTGEIDLQDKTHASQGLVDVISKMIAYHYKQRYRTATEVLQDLKQLATHTTIPAMLTELLQENLPADEELYETQPWPTRFTAVDGDDLPPTEPPPTL